MSPEEREKKDRKERRRGLKGDGKKREWSWESEGKPGREGEERKECDGRKR